jgi:hypothetical protein
VLGTRDILVRRSGSSDPYLWLTDPDADPEGPKTYGSHGFGKLEHLHHSSKIKSHKKLQNSRNQGFPYYFCLMKEGSGSGSVLVTNGFGSGKPKNIRIIRIRMWIRIPNTALIRVWATKYLYVFQSKRLCFFRKYIFCCFRATWLFFIAVYGSVFVLVCTVYFLYRHLCLQFVLKSVLRSRKYIFRLQLLLHIVL